VSWRFRPAKKLCAESLRWVYSVRSLGTKAESLSNRKVSREPAQCVSTTDARNRILTSASPARGQTASPGPVPVLVYSNGISGGPSAFLISAPNVVSNSFVPVVTSPPNADLAELVVWMLPGDQGVLSVSGSVTSAPCAQPPGFSCGVIYGSFVLSSRHV